MISAELLGDRPAVGPQSLFNPLDRLSSVRTGPNTPSTTTTTTTTIINQTRPHLQRCPPPPPPLNQSHHHYTASPSWTNSTKSRPVIQASYSSLDLMASSPRLPLHRPINFSLPPIEPAPGLVGLQHPLPLSQSISQPLHQTQLNRSRPEPDKQYHELGEDQPPRSSSSYDQENDDEWADNTTNPLPLSFSSSSQLSLNNFTNTKKKKKNKINNTSGTSINHRSNSLLPLVQQASPLDNQQNSFGPGPQTALPLLEDRSSTTSQPSHQKQKRFSHHQHPPSLLSNRAVSSTTLSSSQTALPNNLSSTTLPSLASSTTASRRRSTTQLLSLVSNRSSKLSSKFSTTPKKQEPTIQNLRRASISSPLLLSSTRFHHLATATAGEVPDLPLPHCLQPIKSRHNRNSVIPPPPATAFASTFAAAAAALRESEAFSATTAIIPLPPSSDSGPRLPPRPATANTHSRSRSIPLIYYQPIPAPIADHQLPLASQATLPFDPISPSITITPTSPSFCKSPTGVLSFASQLRQSRKTSHPPCPNTNRQSHNKLFKVPKAHSSWSSSTLSNMGLSKHFFSSNQSSQQSAHHPWAFSSSSPSSTTDLNNISSASPHTSSFKLKSTPSQPELKLLGKVRTPSGFNRFQLSSKRPTTTSSASSSSAHSISSIMNSFSKSSHNSQGHNQVILGIKIPSAERMAFGQTIGTQSTLASLDTSSLTPRKPTKKNSISRHTQTLVNRTISKTGRRPNVSVVQKKKKKKSKQCSSQGAADKEHERMMIVIERVEKTFLPIVAKRSLDYLNHWGCREEGIYRIPGRWTDVEKLRTLFDSGCDANLLDYDLSALDPHSVASVFKLWLRELPENIIPLQHDQHINEIMMQDNISSPDERTKKLVRVLEQLPIREWVLIRSIAYHLANLARSQEVNRMDLGNLRLILSPTLKFRIGFLEILVQQRAKLFEKPCLGLEEWMRQEGFRWGDVEPRIGEDGSYESGSESDTETEDVGQQDSWSELEDIQVRPSIGTRGIYECFEDESVVVKTKQQQLEQEDKTIGDGIGATRNRTIRKKKVKKGTDQGDAKGLKSGEARLDEGDHQSTGKWKMRMRGTSSDDKRQPNIERSAGLMIENERDRFRIGKKKATGVGEDGDEGEETEVVRIVNQVNDKAARRNSNGNMFRVGGKMSEVTRKVKTPIADFYQRRRIE